MELTFSNCFAPSGEAINYVYTNCCYQLSCSFVNNQTNEAGAVVSQTIDDFSFFFQNNFFVLNGATITVNGNPISFPYLISANDTLDVVIDFCARQIRDVDTFFFELTLNGGTEFQVVPGDFESIFLGGIASPSTIDFGSIVINTTESVELQITNPSLFESTFTVSTDCPEVLLDFKEPFGIGPNDIGLIVLEWSPTSIGPINCNVTIIEDCSGLELTIPVVGNAVETLPSGGNNVSGKRTVVDCPSGDCRLFNPQPEFAQTTKNAINQISRATRPKGGPGRGTNFR